MAAIPHRNLHHFEPQPGDEHDAFVFEATGQGNYIYTCPSCREKFILDDQRSYKIMDVELKKAILKKIEYKDSWPQNDLLVVVNVYKLL